MTIHKSPLQLLICLLVLGILLFTPRGIALSTTHAQSATPLIMAVPPMEEMCNYSVVFYDRDRFLPAGGTFDPTLLDLAEICGTKVVVRLHEYSTDIAAASGGIDLAAYEDKINDFAGLIDPYVANGTIVAHLTIDEPHDCSDWNGICPTAAQVDQASQISKNYWPTLKTIVNTIPLYASSYTWVSTDNLNFTYAYHKGLLSDFINQATAVVNDGKAAEISWGIQAFSGGCPVYGQCSMSASQILEVGTAMCSTQMGNRIAFLSYDLTLLTDEVQQAINDVRTFCGDPPGPTPTPFSVTGRIFTDYNSDGVYDPATEQPLSGITVDLTPSDGGTVREATSGNDGIYTISALAAGNYTIDILDNTLPPGHADLNGGTDIIVGQAIALGYDFGVRVNSLSGIAFRDNNLNALYEAGSDTPYSGVEIRLTNGVGALVATTTTDAAGMYIFRGLAFDTYTLTVNPNTIDTGWASNPSSRIRLVTDTSNISALDFAIQRPAGTISGHMFADLNSNNTFDAATEPHLANATINLVSASDGTTLSTVTDSSGLYSFTNLVGASYTITVVESTLPAGHASPVGGTINLGQTATIAYDFPIRVNSFSGMVYRDLNTSGVYDTGDTLYPGVRIKITDGTGALVATATSGNSGIYTFRGVPDGNFTLAVDLATVDAGWISIPPSRARTVTRISNVIGLDFGLQPPSAHVGGQIYADLNANNIFDSATESPLSGVTITLTPSGGAALSTTSNADGNYTFSNLSTGSYTLAVVGSSLPAGHATPNSVSLTITQTSNITFNFAVRVNSLSGTTYRDLNHNGLYDAGEQPYSGVTINLTNSNGGLVATTTADSTGAYNFRGLAAGTYTLTPDPATYTAGWISSPATRTRSVTITSNVTALDFGLQPPVATIAGSVFADLDSNNILDGSDYGLQGLIVTLTANSNGSTTTQTTDATGNYAFTNLTTGSYSVAIDPANLPGGYNSLFTGTFTLGQNSNITFNLPLRLNGLVGVAYRDLNSNGVNDAGDQPYAGVVVQLTNSNGAPVGTTTTDSTGTYSFRGLVADTYTAVIDMTSVDAGWASVPTSRTRTLSNNANLTGLDFALQPPIGQINGRVFRDVDANGQYGGSDTPMAGVVVKLQRPDNSIITTSSNATGMYNFSTLSNGNYVISVDAASLPVGHYSLLVSRTVAISGNTINDADFAILRNSVSGRLFTDNDRNRRYGTGDTLLANVVVKLRPTAGGATITSTTDASGNYLIQGIASGSYVLTVDAASLPVGHFSKIASQSVTIQTTSQIKNDFPIWTNDVGGTVFLDLDKDRVYDRPGDQALGNVTLILTLPGGSTRTTTTLSNGTYRFNALAPGTYTITIDATTLPSGTTNAKGTWTVTVANGTYKMTYHFWVWQTAQAH